jgi:hypothetical protein
MNLSIPSFSIIGVLAILLGAEEPLCPDDPPPESEPGGHITVRGALIEAAQMIKTFPGYADVECTVTGSRRRDNIFDGRGRAPVVSLSFVRIQHATSENVDPDYLVMHSHRTSTQLSIGDKRFVEINSNVMNMVVLSRATG